MCGLVERTWGTGVEDAEEGKGDEWEMETEAFGLEYEGEEEEGRGKEEELLEEEGVT